MKEILKSHLNKNINLYNDLISELEKGHLLSKIPNLPSNTIGQQLWCVIGARESYTKAIENGKWIGFACTLDYENSHEYDDVLKCLKDSQNNLNSVIDNLELDDAKIAYVLELIEHEAQHHGQLIRYLYSNKINIPDTWKKRYSLD